MESKKIFLTQGKFCTVDESDFALLNQWKWCALNWSNGKFCAVRNIRRTDNSRTLLYMHRFLMNAPADMEVDHRNGDSLDNRRENIRLATRAQNQQNKFIEKLNNSGYKGVSRHSTSNQWEANISVNGRRIYLGLFYDINSARMAYIAASRFYHGEFSRIK